MVAVVDASVALAWCFEDQISAYSDRVLDLVRDDTAVVPPIWPLEMANAFCVAERRGRIRPADTTRFTSLLLTLPITVRDTDPREVFGDVLRLSRKYDLTSCDASYLDLAVREDIPLATTDERLAMAAREAGVRTIT